MKMKKMFAMLALVDGRSKPTSGGRLTLYSDHGRGSSTWPFVVTRCAGPILFAAALGLAFTACDSLSAEPDDRTSSGEVSAPDGATPPIYDVPNLICNPGLGTLLETLTVPSNGIVVSSESYSSNKLYRIEASGTYDWGGCDPVHCPGGAACGYRRLGDAEHRTDDCWDSTKDEWSFISLYVDGEEVDWGDYNPAHVYSLSRVGNDGSFAFHINDCAHCYPDNSGHLTVRIWEQPVVTTIGPGPTSCANSSPWLIENHEALREMHPRVLALNFVNGRTNADMVARMDEIRAGFREGSRYHGYSDPDAPAFLHYEYAAIVDLTDEALIPEYPWINSTLLPREDPVEGHWGFDYEQLFTTSFAEYYGHRDPEDLSRFLTLCELVERGVVHEVWVYVMHPHVTDPWDVSIAEVLGIKPFYDEHFERLPGPMGRCAGNGCFDAEDVIPPECTRSLRIMGVDPTRGPGCAMESDSHGMEQTSNRGHIPYWSQYFDRFANTDLNDRYDTPFQSWYAVCPGDNPGACLSYPSATSIEYCGGSHSGAIPDYNPVCGNVHFPPNARDHYDQVSPVTVNTSCRSFHMRNDNGSDLVEPFDSSAFSMYNDLYPDCMGGWLVWWRQNMPGLENKALDDEGRPMLNWWPFMFY